MKRQLFRAAALPLAWCLLFPNLAQSATYLNGNAAATMLVSLIVQSGCGIAALPLTFGTRSVLTTAVVGSATITATCTLGTPYNIGLDAGSTPGSTVATRLLANTAVGSTATVSFNLYSDAALQTLWGNTQGTNTVAGNAGTGLGQPYTVYGQIPVQATPLVGNYSTSITATIYY